MARFRALIHQYRVSLKAMTRATILLEVTVRTQLLSRVDNSLNLSKEQGQSRRTTVKTEDSSSVSSWSYTQRPHNDNVNDSSTANSPKSAHTNPTPNQGQAQGTRLRPFSAFPPPPEPSLPLSSVTCKYKVLHSHHLLLH